MADKPVTAKRIRAALRKVAHLMADDSGYAPIYERLERELVKAEARERPEQQAQDRARALLGHNATGTRSSAI